MEFYALLDDLSEHDRTALYQEPNAVRTLFRLLSVASQQAAVRLLYGGQLRLQEIGGQNDCLKDLKRLQVLLQSGTKENEVVYSLHETFRDSLFKVLTTPSASLDGLRQSHDSNAGMDIEAPLAALSLQPSNVELLQVKANEVWLNLVHSLLSYLPGNEDLISKNGDSSEDFMEVNSRTTKSFQTANANSTDITQLLRHSALLVAADASDDSKEGSAEGKRTLKSSKRASGSGQLSLTKLGVQFLLESQQTQLYILLKSYVNMCEKFQNISRLASLSFLLALCFFPPGKPLSFESVTATFSACTSETIQRIVQDWSLYGLTSPIDTTHFYSTPIASSLIDSDISANKGFIIIENNFRLFVYSSSTFTLRLVSLFAERLTSLPNMVVFHIKRKTILHALSLGLSATHVIGFLRRNLHPKVSQESVSVVEIQIQQWEGEKERIKAQKGVLYDAFSSQQPFELTRDYATKLGCVLWENSEKRFLFVKEESHPAMRDFIKGLK